MTPSGRAVPHIAAMYHPAAQAYLALVQHGGLAWRDSPLGLLEMQLALAGLERERYFMAFCMNHWQAFTIFDI